MDKMRLDESVDDLDDGDKYIEYGHDSSVGWWLKNHIIGKPVLTAQREIELGRRIRAGDESACHELVECNLGLVFKIAVAKRSRLPWSVPLADLIQEGNIGLMKAAKKFNPDYGYRFSTYAVDWIAQAMDRAVAYEPDAHIPEYLIAQIGQFRQGIGEITQDLGREPSMQDLVDGFSWSAEKIQLFFDMMRPTKSMDEPAYINDMGRVALGETVADFSADLARILEKRFEEDWIIDCINQFLSPRLALVVKMKLGLDGYQPQTFNGIKAHFGVSKQRVQQMYAEGIKKLGVKMYGLPNSWQPSKRKQKERV